MKRILKHTLLTFFVFVNILLSQDISDLYEILTEDVKINFGSNPIEKEAVQKSFITPVLVYYWGENCPPCTTMESVVDVLGDTSSFGVLVKRCNILDNQMNYTNSAPTLVLVKNGTVKGEKQGVFTVIEIEEWLGTFSIKDE